VRQGDTSVLMGRYWRTLTASSNRVSIARKPGRRYTGRRGRAFAVAPCAGRRRLRVRCSRPAGRSRAAAGANVQPRCGARTDGGPAEFGGSSLMVTGSVFVNPAPATAAMPAAARDAREASPGRTRSSTVLQPRPGEQRERDESGKDVNQYAREATPNPRIRAHPALTFSDCLLLEAAHLAGRVPQGSSVESAPRSRRRAHAGPWAGNAGLAFRGGELPWGHAFFHRRFGPTLPTGGEVRGAVHHRA
jgi:hypothetical protein